MHALADALARANPFGYKSESSLPYATDASEHSKAAKVSWIDWNDLAGLTELLRAKPKCELIPVEIFERRGPARSNPRYKFNTLRSLEFLIFRRRSAILFGKPILIGDFSEGNLITGVDQNTTPAISLARLVRILKLERSRSLRLVRGVPFQSQRAQETQVLSGPEFERELGLVAQKHRLSIAQARALTRKEFRTISASPVRWLFTFCAGIARWIIKQLFSEVSIVGMNQFIEAARGAAVVLVPMHRSHLDYILVGSVLYDSRLNTPVVAAGLNLSFWPVGPIIRSLGAYFVRRNARNDRVHSLVLKRYVTYLTKRGHLQEFFIEGGRSRSGRMRAPKLGLLNIMVDACAKGLRKELLFVPVSISYETVVEERSLAEENTGIKKRSEHISDLISLPRVFRRSYGEVVLQFGRPLSLSAMLGRVRAASSSALQDDQATSSKAKPDTRAVVKELANALTTRLRSQSSISLSSLICTALLSAQRYGVGLQELETRLVLLARLANLARLQNPELGTFTKSLELFLERPETLRSILAGRLSLFKIRAVVDEEIVFVPGVERYRADFYKNSCQHVFFPIAVACAAQRLANHTAFAGMTFENRRTTDSALLWTIDLVHAALEKEFLLGTKEEFSHSVFEALKILATEKLAQAPISGAGSQFISTDNATRLDLAPEIMRLSLDNIVLVPLESMLWVAERLESSSYEINTPIVYKEFLRRAQEEYRPAAYRPSGSPSRTESGSQSNLAGGLEMLEALEIIEIQEGASGPTNLILRQAHSAILQNYDVLAKAIRAGNHGAQAVDGAPDWAPK